MDFSSISIEMVVNVLILLLIGMGPKIALVPFLEKTKGFEPKRQRAIGKRMVLIGLITALVLFAAGGYLMKLLHVSPGGVGVGGGIILMLIALNMIKSPGKPHTPPVEESSENDAKMALYPLAVPYLINPAGMVILIVISGRLDSIISAPGVVMLGLILAVGLFDFLVFSNIDRLAKKMRPETLVISEVVFGLLLTALSVEMIVRGLAALGVLHGVTLSH